MILGVGIDACEIARMQAQIEKPHFLSRVLTERERDYIEKKGGNAAQSLAALFAAKEAALKALGTGISGVASLSDIEICHHPSGQPYYVFYRDAKALTLGGTMHLSVTHEANLAIAVAIFEKEPSC